MKLLPFCLFFLMLKGLCTGGANIAYQLIISSLKIINSMRTQKSTRSRARSKIQSERNATIKHEANNANSFKHLLTLPTANPSSIKWASQLRSTPQIRSLKQSKDYASIVPQVYLKNTLGRKQKHSAADISSDTNISTYEHLAMHRLGTQAPNSLVNFETSLRAKAKLSKQKQLENNWSSLPKKQRNQEPNFIKTSSIKKKTLKKEDLEGGMDGCHHYPKFSQKIIKVRNYNQFRHMLKGQVNLPSIGWQTNLRLY